MGTTQRKQHSRLHCQSRKVFLHPTQQGTGRRRWCGLHPDCRRHEVVENGKNADISEVQTGFKLQTKITMP